MKQGYRVALADLGTPTLSYQVVESKVINEGNL
jgi:hypothetical protein